MSVYIEDLTACDGEQKHTLLWFRGKDCPLHSVNEALQRVRAAAATYRVACRCGSSECGVLFREAEINLNEALALARPQEA